MPGEKPVPKTPNIVTSYILGAALVFGGAMGFMKGSIASLIAGSGSGILMLVCARFAHKNHGEGIMASCALSFVLFAVMGIRYFSTGAALSGYVALACFLKFALDFSWGARVVINTPWN